MELEVLSPCVVIEPTIQPDFLLSLLENKLDAIDDLQTEIGESVTQEEKDNRKGRLARPLSLRPNVGIIKYDETVGDGRQKYHWLTSMDDLKELIESVTNIQKVSGKDADGIVRFYADLPENYCARCPYIRFRHLPPWAKYKSTVSLVILSKDKEKQQEPRHIAEDVYVFSSDRAMGDLTKDAVKKIYHKVSFRVNMETATLESYNPGIDFKVDRIQTAKAAIELGEEPSDLDTVVLVGTHFGKHRNHDAQPAPTQVKNDNKFFRGVVVNK